MNEKAQKKLQQLLDDGPFKGRMDPWAEVGHYFSPIHAGMISHLLDQTRSKLLEMGYVAGREMSLQITEGREPDILVLRRDGPPERFQRWNYELSAVEILAEPGVVVQDEPDLQSLHIRDGRRGDLVTVVEIVSPTNKLKVNEITAYQERRSRLYLERGVNVVEVDLTRSVKRLTFNTETTSYPYHVAIFLPAEGMRVAGIEFEQPPHRIALPLRGEVIAAELRDAYGYAYRQNTTAWHIEHDKNYTEDKLPFPSLLTDQQRQDALAALAQWQAEVQRLQTGG